MGAVLSLRKLLHTVHTFTRYLTISDTFRTNSFGRCLASAADTYPLSEVEHQVRALVCDTLKEYKCLETCMPLRRYISEVAKVCWLLVNGDPPFELDTDFQTPIVLQPDRHQRHHSSDRSCDTIRSFLWPALMQRAAYVHKAVVITGVVA